MGVLRPGVGLWAFRDFLRRTATLQHSLGNPVVVYTHMTNVNVLPVLSWASITLDWEWQDHDGQEREDYQTRNALGCDDHGNHCNDTSMVLAQSLGLQSGNIPVVLDEQKAKNCSARPDLNTSECLAWLTRTQWAVCLPHEIRPLGIT